MYRYFIDIMSYPLYLAAEQNQIHIVHGYDAPPVKSDRGMFMRTIPMQQAVVVDEDHAQRLLDVSNRIPPHRTRQLPGKINKKVGRQPQLANRMYVLPDAEYTYPTAAASSSSSVLVDSANKFYLFSISLIGLYMFYRIMRMSAESHILR